MDSLPEELLRLICTYLPLHDRKQLRLACSLFRPFSISLRTNDRWVIDTYENLVNYNLSVRAITIRLNPEKLPEEAQNSSWKWQNSGDYVEEVELEICECQDNCRVMLEVFTHFATLKTIRLELAPCCRGLSHGTCKSNTEWVALMGSQPNLECLAFERYQWGGLSRFSECRKEFAQQAAIKWGSQLKEFRTGHFNCFSSTDAELETFVHFLGKQIKCTDVFLCFPGQAQNALRIFENYPNLERVALEHPYLSHPQNITHFLSLSVLPSTSNKLAALHVAGDGRREESHPGGDFHTLRIYIGPALITNPDTFFNFEVMFFFDRGGPLHLLSFRSFKFSKNIRCLCIPELSTPSNVRGAVDEINKLVGLVQFAWTRNSPLPDLHLLKLPLLEDLYLQMTLTPGIISTLFTNCPRLQNLYCHQKRGVTNSVRLRPGANVHNVRSYRPATYSIFRERRKMFFFYELKFSQLEVARRNFMPSLLADTSGLP